MDGNMTNCPNFDSKAFRDKIRNVIDDAKPTSPLNKTEFMNMVRKAKELKPEPIKANMFKEYPGINAESLNFTVEDFTEAAAFYESHMSIIEQFVDEKIKMLDKVIFDCFRSHLGCQNADDVFLIMTSPVMIQNYNNMIPYINTQIKNNIGPFGSPDGMKFIELTKMKEPIKGSRELLEAFRSRWDELYNDEGDDDDES